VNDFVPVYSAVIITKGSNAFVKQRDGLLFLEGVRVDPDECVSPKHKILDKLSEVAGFGFSEDWILYIGATIHDHEITPDGEELNDPFVVVHYWIDVSTFAEFMFNKDQINWVQIPLEHMAENKDKNVLYADQLAAKRVIEMRSK
jgi:hypothetical protein